MKKAVVWIVTLLVLAAGALLLYAQSERIMSFFYSSQSNAAAESGRLESAALALEKELSLKPEDAALRMRVTDAFLAYENYARAEYHLVHGLRLDPSEILFYRKLCSIYVAQDKLTDAVALLDEIADPSVSEQIAAQRPSAPESSPASGRYTDLVELSVTAAQGCRVYVNLNGQPPSVERDEYTSPVTLSSGKTQIQAVAVDADGLVSPWYSGEYTLENIKMPVVFADPAVERITRALLERPTGSISSDELSEITEIIQEEPATYLTLSDLALFTNLETLSLAGTDTECDLTALTGLSSLTSLTLHNFHIDMVGLDPIGQMTQLQTLVLTENRIASLTPLSGLTELTELNLSANSIIDVSPLAPLTALKTLRLTQNAIENIQPLTELVGLQVLNLRENRVSGLYGIQTLKALTALDLSYNNLSDLAHLGSLTSLRALYLGHNNITSLEPLLPLRGLTLLNISANAVTGLEGLQRMEALKEFDASDNAIASLSGIESCVSLQTLNMNKNGLQALAPLSGLPALKTLYVEHNRLTTLKALLECPALERVFAFGNELTDPLDMFYNVKTIVNRG